MEYCLKIVCFVCLSVCFNFGCLNLIFISIFLDLWRWGECTECTIVFPENGNIFNRPIWNLKIQLKFNFSFNFNFLLNSYYFIRKHRTLLIIEIPFAAVLFERFHSIFKATLRRPLREFLKEFFKEFCSTGK